MLQKVKDFWKKYESKIFLVLGFVLIAGISFEAGLLKNQEIKQNPLVIEKPIKSHNNTEKNSQKQDSVSGEVSGAEDTNLLNKKDCTFVGSKNSDKYHLPNCRFAKNIKPENLACFSSADEAKSKGYVPDKNCIK